MAFLAALALADTDPKAGVEADNFSSPLSTFGAFNPTANGGVVDLYNDTGTILDSLTLNTTIATSLTNADIAQSFSCNSGAQNPFFMYCGFNYNPSTGGLSIDFYGVNPPDGDEYNGSDDEVGEQEGIPPVVGACLLNPDTLVCNDVGHFAFVFNDDLSVAGSPNNGWVAGTVSSANPGTQLFDGSPVFAPPLFNAVPEPSTIPLLAGEVLALCGLSWRRLRGLRSKR
jgi:hypothetical protein